MKKATHQGHCQVCGNIQKLPGGLLAAHGYTVEGRGMGGYFSGTCWGSHHQPYQESCELVKDSIARATTAMNRLIEISKAHQNKPTPDNVMIKHKHHASLWAFHTPCKLVRMAGTVPVYTVISDTENKEHTKRFGGYRGDLNEVAARLNKEYADAMDAEARQLSAYIVEQTARVKAWKPSTLIALKG